MSSDLERIAAALKHVPESRHSYFQLKYFVIGKEVTTQAQMWQCLRELQSRKQTIDGLTLSIEETKDQLELIEIDHAKDIHNLCHGGFNCHNYPEELREREKVIKHRQHERKRQQLQNSLVQLEDSLKFAWQEAMFFLQLFEAIRKVEPLKDYDDLDAQKEYWNERISQQINLKMLLQQPLDTELVQTALSLHENAPIRLQMQNTLDHIQGQMKQLKDQYMHQLGTKESNGESKSHESRQKLPAR